MSGPTATSAGGERRAGLRSGLAAWCAPLVELCAQLVQCVSINPPGDTRAAAETLCRFLAGREGIMVRRVAPDPARVNVVAILRGRRPGRRLVFNGHLDTGPVPEPERWSAPPFGGMVRDGRIYGRGVSDMKAGVAAQAAALAALAPLADHLAGELVMTAVADEGSGAALGARHLFETVPEAGGDALLSADVGSPDLAIIGEKGFLWLALSTRGRSAGGAHAHLGVNAADRLIDALLSIRSLAAMPCALPPDLAAMTAADRLDEAGQAARRAITVNLGRFESGIACNQVPAEARALVDVRLPPGTGLAEILTGLRERIGGQDIAVQVIDSAEANWTRPDAEIVRLVQRAGAEVRGAMPRTHWRLGFSDARFWRAHGVPAVGYGVSAHNGNAPDEHVLIDELIEVFAVHALSAFDFLSSDASHGEVGG